MWAAGDDGKMGKWPWSCSVISVFSQIQPSIARFFEGQGKGWMGFGAGKWGSVRRGSGNENVIYAVLGQLFGSEG